MKFRITDYYYESMGKKFAWLSICASAVLVLTACAPSKNDSSSNKKVVLTTFTVIADMAKTVAGDHLEISSITKPGAEIHDYAPTPEDIKKAQKADLILNNGLGLERWFERFVADSKAMRAVVSEGIEAIPIAEGEYKDRPNPHAWMSYKAGKVYIENIMKAFIKLDPEHAQDYRENARKYQEELEKLGREMIEKLDTLPVNQRVLVTCEGAFSYLARDAGMEEKYLWAVNAENAMKPSQIADVINYVKDNKVPAVFCESTAGDNKMLPVAKETGAKMGKILYVDSLSEADGPVPSYLKLLEYDTKTITEALTGK